MLTLKAVIMFLFLNYILDFPHHNLAISAVQESFLPPVVLINRQFGSVRAMHLSIIRI